MNNLKCLVSALSLVLTLPAFAFETANAKATATLSATCSISASNISFGELPFGQNIAPSSGTISVLCTNKTQYKINVTYDSVTSQYGVNCPAMISTTNAFNHTPLYYGLYGSQGLALFGVNNQLISQIGTGNVQNIAITARIQPTANTYPAGVCGSNGLYNGQYPMQVPPDSYAGNAILVITY
jgi:spore coat protein U-like protein